MAYAALAPIYDRAGMGDYASSITPRLLNYAQRSEWMGRRVIDLGCGTGVSTIWFAQQGYMSTGVDRSLEMLTKARQKASELSLSINFEHADLSSVEGIGPTDMVIALDVFNEMDNVRDLEAAFSHIHSLLSPNRMFIFDLHTIEGLTLSSMNADKMVYNGDDLAVYTHTHYDYERQQQTMKFNLFAAEDDSVWHRARAVRVRRAFPVQAVATLLRRQRFEVRAVLDTSLNAYDFAAGGADRVIFFAANV